MQLLAVNGLRKANSCVLVTEVAAGDRTMLDALDPFVRSFNSSGANASRDVLLSAVEAAERGAEAPPQ